MSDAGWKGGGVSRQGRSRVRGAARTVFLVGLLMATVHLAPASAQVFTFDLDISPMGPGTVTVGQTNLPGSLVLANNSAGLTPVTITGIQFNPSCGDFTTSCTSPELGVFSLAPNATGIGGVCTGQAFTVSGPDGTGKFTFTPTGSLVLQAPPGANSTCTIGFTFNVLKVPTVDSLPGTPGQQTTRWAMVSGTAQTTTGGQTVTGSARGIASINVNKIQPTIATQVSSTSVAAGAAVTDTATVAGGVAGFPITGNVTFRVYGPTDPGCTGTAVFTSTVVVAGNGTATSGAFTPALPGTYRFVATYDGNVNYATAVGICGVAGETVVVVSAGRYTPLTPARILDTRDGTGGVTGPIGSGSTAIVQVAGRGGVPASGAAAVALNVTATQPTADGFLTIYPSGTARPVASNLNFSPGKTVPNMVVVKLGTGGAVDVFNSAGTTHVLFDVAGWFSEVPTGNDGRYQALTPARILDTRDGTGGSSVKLGPNASLDLQVAGAGGVPVSGARAAVMNVAVTGTTATSFLTVYPTGEARPGVSNLNWVGGDTVSNRVFVKLGTAGKVTLYNGSGETNIIVDVNGWFTDATVAGTNGTFTPLTPARILDTRFGVGGIMGPLGAGSTVDVQVTGQGGVPASGVTAVVLNATVVSPSGMGFLTVFPTGVARPNASDVNYAAGETRPNLVVVKLGTGGKVSVYTQTGTHVIFDVTGWIT